MPRRDSSSTHRKKPLAAGRSPKSALPATQSGGGKPGSVVPSTNTPICARVTAAPGQYNGGVTWQPFTTPRRDSSSIQGQNPLDAGTSSKISLPPTQAGGANPAP